MNQTKRKFGIGRGIRLALLAAMLITVAAVFVQQWLERPLAAVAFAVCGQAQGAVIIQRNGDNEFYKPGDPELFIQADKIPADRKGTLRYDGPSCNNNRPQVF